MVTVFKKNCASGDLWYRKCRASNHCIRSDYFCDTMANCLWPSGEDATDERDCREWNPSPLAGTEDRARSVTHPTWRAIYGLMGLSIVGVANILQVF